MQKKLSHPPIEGKQVRLRLLEASDVEQVRLWRNAEHIRVWFKDDRIIDPAQQRAWYEKYKLLSDDYIYIVEWRDLNWQPIGQVAIYHIDWECKKAEFGRILVGNQEASAKGLLYEASSLIIGFWKEMFGIVSYFLEVRTNNLRAIHLYKMLGFEVESESNGYLTMCLQR